MKVLDCMVETWKTAIALYLWLVSSVEANDGESIAKKEIQCVMSHEWIYCEAVNNIFLIF